MKKDIIIPGVIAVLTILTMVIIALLTLSHAERIAEQNGKKMQNLVDEAMKDMNEKHFELIELFTPKSIIDCWLSEKNVEEGTYKIMIMNNGDKLKYIENIELWSLISYNPMGPKDIDVDKTFCELEDKWLSSGKTITRTCFSDFKVNHIFLDTEEGLISCKMKRSFEDTLTSV